MEIEQIKNANTQYLGKEIAYYSEIDSTQEEAKRRINTPLKNGTIFLTDEQTQGKGTKGRTWYTSKQANITMTIAMYPNCEIEKLEELTITIAEVIRNTIGELYGIVLTIKEPNDVLLNGKKIGGILTESATYQNIVQHLIIGIGFNVNETCFSEETKEIATSLKQEYGKDYSREEIIIKFIEKFEQILQEKQILKGRKEE